MRIPDRAVILSRENIGKECQRHPYRLLRFYCATQGLHSRVPFAVRACIVFSLVIPEPIRLSRFISETRIDPGQYLGIQPPDPNLLFSPSALR
jgi:hypothetical protein